MAVLRPFVQLGSVPRCAWATFCLLVLTDGRSGPLQVWLTRIVLEVSRGHTVSFLLVEIWGGVARSCAVLCFWIPFIFFFLISVFEVKLET